MYVLNPSLNPFPCASRSVSLDVMHVTFEFTLMNNPYLQMYLAKRRWLLTRS